MLSIFRGMGGAIIKGKRTVARACCPTFVGLRYKGRVESEGGNEAREGVKALRRRVELE